MKGSKPLFHYIVFIILFSLFACTTQEAVLEQEITIEETVSDPISGSEEEPPLKERVSESPIKSEPPSKSEPIETKIDKSVEPEKAVIIGPETVPKELSVLESIDIAEMYETQAAVLTTGLSLEEKVGQLFIISLWNTEENNFSVKAGKWEQEQLTFTRPGGVILFGGNIDTEEQVKKLCLDLQRHSLIPLFIATDQEGGYIGRLHESGKIPATHIPTPLEIGRTGNSDLAYLAGWLTGRECAALGINTDFAPVADLLRETTHPVIGSRSFGNDPEMVANMSVAFADGIRDGGVLPVMKHFPGHGGGTGDPHQGNVIDQRNQENLISADLLPFSRGVTNGVECIMLAHVTLPEITGDDLPASYSPYIHKTLLRESLGFEGITITDSIAMGAISGRWELADSVIKAVQGGVDCILEPPGPRTAYNALLTAVRDGIISEERIYESVKRILTVKLRAGIIEWKEDWGKNPSDFIPMLKEQRYETVLSEYIPEWKIMDNKGVGNSLHTKINLYIAEKIAAGK